MPFLDDVDSPEVLLEWQHPGHRMAVSGQKPLQRRLMPSCGGHPPESHSGEPIVSAIFSKPARKAVGHEYCSDPLRILEPELGRNAKLERIAVARRPDLVGDLEGEKGLRMQRRAGIAHVAAGQQRRDFCARRRCDEEAAPAKIIQGATISRALRNGLVLAFSRVGSP